MCSTFFITQWPLWNSEVFGPELPFLAETLSCCIKRMSIMSPLYWCFEIKIWHNDFLTSYQTLPCVNYFIKTILQMWFQVKFRRSCFEMKIWHNDFLISYLTLSYVNYFMNTICKCDFKLISSHLILPLSFVSLGGW